MQNKLFVLFMVFFTSACSTSPDFKEDILRASSTRLILYRPPNWQTMLGSHKIYLNDKPLLILKNASYHVLEIQPGLIKIQSHHVQEPEQVVELKINAVMGQAHIIKLDTDPVELTLMGVTKDILAISTFVAGMKSQIKIESGQGSLSDLSNVISEKKRQEEVKSSPKKSIGHHLLLHMSIDAATEEIMACSSKNVELL